MRRLICYLKAIPFFLRSGIWCPHQYIEVSREPKIVISTDYGFRVSEDYKHELYEKVHPKATLIRSKCLCCGKEDVSWFDGSYEDIQVIKE